MKKVLILGGASYDEIIRLDKLPEPRSSTVFGTGWHAVDPGPERRSI